MLDEDLYELMPSYADFHLPHQIYSVLSTLAANLVEALVCLLRQDPSCWMY